MIREELKAELLNSPNRLSGLVDDVVVGAMGVKTPCRYFKQGVLLITPGDREDIILAACTGLDANSKDMMAGIILTGNLRPSASVLKVIRAMPIPVLLTEEETYRVASRVHDRSSENQTDRRRKDRLNPRPHRQKRESG